MSPLLIFSVISIYFTFLIIISYFTGRKSNFASFFNANKQSPWYLVAFGMIGASLSGVTFISIPGEVGSTDFTYFQIVLGYLVGYFVIITVLLPIYYKQNLTSIYTYLEKRFGFWSHKTGSSFFILSRVIGASFRLFLVANVLQIGLFDKIGVPFFVTVPLTIALIWVYTYKAGIKTIVWTDTLQTFFMLLAVVISIVIISKELNMNFTELFESVKNSKMSRIFDFELNSPTNFYKQFIAGALIAIVMTGLDQDMMQKNLTCRNLKDAQKNMFWFSIILVPVNLLFLTLGALLYIYSQKAGITIPSNTDDLYPILAFEHFSLFAGITFLLGITAAAFSSADSALTALTSSFSIDILNIDINKNDKKVKRTKILVHLMFSVILFMIILAFKSISSDSVITAVFNAASYTYGPILGMFAFGIITKLKTLDSAIPFVAVISPIVAFMLNFWSAKLFNGYVFGFELLGVNALLTFGGMYIFSFSKKMSR